MEQKIKEEIKKGIKFIQEKESKRKTQKYLGKDIAWLFFTKYTYGSEVLKYLDVKEYKRREKTYTTVKEIYEEKKKKEISGDEKAKKWIEKHNAYKNKLIYIYKTPKNTNHISDCFKLWNKLKFLHSSTRLVKVKVKNISPHNRDKKIYKFNLNPFFEYCKNYKISFTKEEERLLEFIFTSKPTRERIYNEYKTTDFLTAIPKFYLKYFFIPFYTKRIDKKDIEKIEKKFKFGKESIKHILSIEPSSNKLREIEFDILEPDNGKFTKVDILREKEIEEKTIYYIDLYFKNIHKIFIEKKEKGKRRKRYTFGTLVNSNRELYLVFYILLHKYYPNIIKSLDNHMLKLEGLEQKYI